MLTAHRDGLSLSVFIPEYNCNSLIDEDLKIIIKIVLKWIQIGAPILLILLVTVDFGQAVISNDNDAIKKATSKAIKRTIAALALFFIPLIVRVLIDKVDSTPFFDKDKTNCSDIFK